MKKLYESLFLFGSTMFLFSLAGCGGGGSSSPDSAVTVLYSGVVEDGPIENARISLIGSNGILLSLCGPKGNERCETATDAEGAFSLQVPAGIDSSTLSLLTRGGRDRTTGVDFTGLEMRAPLVLFAGEVSALVVSPLTTLVAELQAQGLPLDTARNRLRSWLLLPTATTLEGRPSSNLALQRRALLLTKMALEHQDAQPFSRIGTEAGQSNTPLLAEEGRVNPEVLHAIGFDVDAQAQIVLLQELLAATPTIEDAGFIYKREELMSVISATIQQMLGDSALFDPQNASYRENLRILAEMTLHASGNEVIPLQGTIPQRLARYVLFTYQFRTWESLTDEASSFAGKIALLKDDPWIAELARSHSLYSVVSPLLLTELPGDDNQQRLNYFYGSDVSPHFRAEQLIGLVFDDAINDAVLLKIIEGKANAGLINETSAIIETQIVQSEPRAHSYLALAKALIKFNRLEEARSALARARDLYLEIIDRKGKASASATDVDNLLATSSSYRKAGDLVNSQRLLEDVADIATALSVNAITYGKLITGIKNVADVYISTSDFVAARLLVESMYSYSGLTPAYNSTYQLRIYNWSECAKRFAALGDRARVLQVASDIASLRAAEATTATVTWVYVPDVVESLYRVGATVEAFTLAGTIPSGSNQIKAFKQVAIYESLQGSLDTAFSLVDDDKYFSKVEDRLDLLTYFAANRKNPGIALSLINAGRFAEARLALEKAESLLPGMTQGTNLARIRYGYVKVAELYAEIGDFAKAASLLQSAQAAIIDDVYRVAVMIDIALGYQNFNQTNVALPILASARTLADADPSRYRTDVIVNLSPPEAATILYEAFIKAYEEIGDNGLIYTTTINSFLPWAQKIHTRGTVNDPLAGKECDYLLRGVLYLENAGDHDGALEALTMAWDSAGQLAIVANRLKKYLSVITNYAAVHEYEQALDLALSLEYTSERNQAIQTLANGYVDRDDFPDSPVASIDSDGDGKPDFFNPLASAEDILDSGLLQDDDSDGDSIVDTRDLRPLFVD